MRIFVTGGHLTPALATIAELNRQQPDWEVIFIGRPPEESQVKQLGIKFLLLSTGRFPRELNFKLLESIFLIWRGLLTAYRYCRVYQPNLIVSFGGYLAAPLALVGRLLGITIITHEQTHVPGLANRLIGLLAKKICLGFPEALRYFPPTKTVMTGLPLRFGLFKPPIKPSFQLTTRLPIIYITGGITGAVSLNQICFPIIKNLTKNHFVIHQTGGPSLSRAQQLQQSLPREQQDHYLVKDGFALEDVSWILAKAVLVISRAGANTVAELAALGKISVLVPLPWSAGGEQLANSHWLEERGTTRVLMQENLTPETLLTNVMRILREAKKYELAASVLSKSFPRDGAQRLCREILLNL